MKTRTISVSYTHLDVYKRQEYWQYLPVVNNFFFFFIYLQLVHFKVQKALKMGNQMKIIDSDSETFL